MSAIFSSITILIIRTISTLGYPSVFLLMTLHSAAIPLPGEIVMPFSGFCFLPEGLIYAVDA